MNAEPFPIALEDNVAILKLDGPACLDVAGKHALTRALGELKGREGFRALIIAGDHPQAFLVNVAELADMSADAARDFSASGHALAAALEALPFPAVAAVGRSGAGRWLRTRARLRPGVRRTRCELRADRGDGRGHARLRRQLAARPTGWISARARNDVQRRRRRCRDRQVLRPCVGNRGAGGALDAARAFAQRLAPTSAASVAAIKAAAIFGWNRDPAEINRFEEDRFATLFGSEQSQRMHAFLARQGHAEP